MTDTDTAPACFGRLERVFPMGPDGLRKTPAGCLACRRKTQCLRTAMQGMGGTVVRQEMVDRAYGAGTLTFFGRWAKTKTLVQHKRRNRDRHRGFPWRWWKKTEKD